MVVVVKLRHHANRLLNLHVFKVAIRPENNSFFSLDFKLC